MLHFIDVGANVGQTFDYLAQYPEYDGCTVWCLEPSPRSLMPLVEKVKTLRDKYKVHVCTFGLGGGTGAYRLFLKKDGSTADSFLEKMGANEDEVLAIIQDVNTFIEERTKPADHVVLKLDCEGSEYPILRRLLESNAVKRVKKILVEYHQTENEESIRRSFDDAYHTLGLTLEPWMM